VRGREVWPVAYPRGPVQPSDFRIVEVDVPRPGPGEVLVRNTWTSVDAALRLRLRERVPAGYFPAFPLGRPMDGVMTVGEVVESRAEGYAPGDTVRHAAGWRDYAVISAVEAGRPGPAVGAGPPGSAIEAGQPGRAGEPGQRGSAVGAGPPGSAIEAGQPGRAGEPGQRGSAVGAGQPGSARGQTLGGLGALTKLDLHLASAPDYLGVLGAAGLTAYAGLIHVAGLRDGDTVWVSAAAGSVGSLAVQLAKARGHRVVGSAGSPEKVRYLLDELGADAAFDHRAGSVADLLRKAAPDGIDVYFDNVGGDHLEAALGALRKSGRVALCGMVSQYQMEEPPPGPRNLMLAVTNELTIRGFRVSGLASLVPEMTRELAALVRAGRLRSRETIVDGLANAPAALVGLLRGANTGKTLVRIG
jgi:NADPH-dependent curcumin reductase CurA